MSTKRKKIYLGMKNDPTFAYELFREYEEPTRKTHGERYLAVIGPFKTVRGAKFMQMYGKGNPHCQHVNDAERLAKLP